MSTYAYNAKALAISFAGILIEGFADGDVVTISNESDAFGDAAGTDGDVTRYANNDRRATVTIRTMQSSPANDQLSAIHELDKISVNGAGVATLDITDTLGSSNYNASKAWIMKGPDATFGREVKEREWRFRCADLSRTDGSNLEM